jgi:hypothetical protein
MNCPAASHGVSKARQGHETLLEASFGVWTRGAIIRKPLFISSNLLVQSFGRYAVKFRQIAIKHDLMTPNEIDFVLDHFNRNKCWHNSPLEKDSITAEERKQTKKPSGVKQTESRDAHQTQIC